MRANLDGDFSLMMYKRRLGLLLVLLIRLNKRLWNHLL